MSTLSFRDLELLSAYLDRELSQKEKTRLVARIIKEPELARALEDLRQTRHMLRRTPRRKAPRNFTLTPKMAGIRPPVPRLVPALSWASAVAMVMFVCTLGYSLISSAGSFGAAAPKAADNGYSIQSAPAATAAPATQAPATMPPATSAPAIQDTQAPVVPPAPVTPIIITPTPGSGQPLAPNPAQRTQETSTSTPRNLGQVNPFVFTLTPTLGATPTETPGITTMMVPQATVPAAAGAGSTTPTQTAAQRARPWAYVWLGLAIVLVAAAFLLRWWNRRSFARKIRQ